MSEASVAIERQEKSIVGICGLYIDTDSNAVYQLPIYPTKL